MRNLVGGLVLGLGTLLTPALASADPHGLAPRVEFHAGGPGFRVDVTPAGFRGDGRQGFGQPIRVPAPPVAYVPPQPVYVPAPAPVGWNYAGGRYDGWQRRRAEVQMFGAQLRREVAGIERDLYFDVQSRVVRPEVMQALEAGRQEVERDFANAAAKGFLTFEDKAHLQSHVGELRGLRSQYACRHGFDRGFGHGFDHDRDEHVGWNGRR